MRRALPIAMLLLAAAGAAAAQEAADERRRELQDEIGRMEAELAALGRREGGVLHELERVSAELSLGRARVEAIRLSRAEVAERVAAHERTLLTLGQAQTRRERYLAFRLREIYKGGSTGGLRRILGAPDAGEYWQGLQYAAFLSARDAAVLAGYRDDAQRAESERAALTAERRQLEAAESAAAAANRQLEQQRSRQRGLLDQIRGDTARRETALDELRAAADELTRVIEGLHGGEGGAALDIEKFRGLLDWPAKGRVRSGFGTVVHPRFKTRVPHPGLDIEAPAGASILSVFEGEVVFSGWMRGYGLTAIVDHGHGAHTVYAHAAVLWVEPGETVRRGQRLGIVGETGSFSGPSLYFELRLNGRAVDPEEWLKRK